MKFLMTALVCLGSCTLAFSQKWVPEWTMGYVYSVPTLDMKNTITDAHGFQMAFGITPPGGRLTYGAELNLSTYGHESSRQQYTMEDGSTAPMDVVVNNNFFNLQASGRFNLFSKGAVRPYVMLKGGYAWYLTELTIQDPDLWDQCEPVDSEVLKNDGAFIGSAGCGIQINLSGSKKARKNLWYLDLQTSVTAGGKVSYMNSDAPTQHNHSSTQHNDVTLPFLNTQTQVVHQHHVGYVYSSYINLMDFRIGFTLKPGILD